MAAWVRTSGAVDTGMAVRAFSASYSRGTYFSLNGEGLSLIVK